MDLVSAPEAAPILAIVAQAAQVDPKQAQTVLRLLFLIVHGYASMYANNDLAFDEKVISEDLQLALEGVLAALKGEA